MRTRFVIEPCTRRFEQGPMLHKKLPTFFTLQPKPLAFYSNPWQWPSSNVKVGRHVHFNLPVKQN